MDNLIKSLFINFRLQLIDQGLIDNEAIFIDGTKIEANANKYTFVFKKAVKNYDKKLMDNAKNRCGAGFRISEGHFGVHPNVSSREI